MKKNILKGNSSVLQFVKSTGIFFIGSSLSKMISFFLLPIYTSYISTDDFGYYDLSITYLTVCISLVFCDIWVSALRHMYDETNEEKKGHPLKAASVLFVLSFGIYVLGALALYFLANIPCLSLITTMGLLQAITNFYTFISRGYRRNIDFAISGIICTLSAALINIWQLAIMHMDYSSLYYSMIIGYSLQIVYLECRVHIFKRIIHEKIDWVLVKKMFFYTLPLGINAVAFWILNSFNRIAISHVLSVSENGIYAVGQKFANMLSFAMTCFLYAWQDLAFSKQENKGSFYSKACTSYYVFLGIAISGLLPFIKIVFPFLVRGSYDEAEMMIPLSLAAAAMSGYSSFIGNIFYAIKNTKIIFISTVLSCIINLILCFPLISLLGLNGANLSILLSFTANVFFRNIILKKEIGMHLQWKKIMGITALVLASALFYIYSSTYVNMGLLFILGISIVWCLGVYLKKRKIIIK